MDNGRIVTINGGSSTIKFAVFQAGRAPVRTITGMIDRVGEKGTSISARGKEIGSIGPESITASTHEQAAEHLADWLRNRLQHVEIEGVGHRIVHGGIHLTEHQVITDELVAELRRTVPLDPAHLLREIALIDSFRRCFTGVPEVACFDTAFHRDLPTVARLLAIPRSYLDAGVRRFGFHGLSFEYLLSELGRIAPGEAAGRVILGHLGSGASMAAVQNGAAIDTTMAFTPTAGLVMGTRPGDIDPGLLIYLMRTEKLNPEQMDEFINQKCGLLGVSASSSDMRDLIGRRGTDSRAADAVDLFCYQARKWIGALAAAMGGLDSLVFSGGIGEHSADARAGICRGLEFLGIHLDEAKNSANAALISAGDSRVPVRVMATDEEITIARIVGRVLDLKEN